MSEHWKDLLPSTSGIEKRIAEVQAWILEKGKFYESFLESPKDQNISQQRPSKKVKVSRDLFYQPASSSSGAEAECHRYFTKARYNGNLTALQWWKENRSEYPALSQVVRAVFGLSATSTSVKRVFSGAARVWDKSRPIAVDTAIRQTMVRTWIHEGIIPLSL